MNMLNALDMNQTKLNDVNNGTSSNSSLKFNFIVLIIILIASISTVFIPYYTLIEYDLLNDTLNVIQFFSLYNITIQGNFLGILSLFSLIAPTSIALLITALKDKLLSTIMIIIAAVCNIFFFISNILFYSQTEQFLLERMEGYGEPYIPEITQHLFIHIGFVTHVLICIMFVIVVIKLLKNKRQRKQ